MCLPSPPHTCLPLNVHLMSSDFPFIVSSTDCPTHTTTFSNFPIQPITLHTHWLSISLARILCCIGSYPGSLFLPALPILTLLPIIWILDSCLCSTGLVYLDRFSGFDPRLPHRAVRLCSTNLTNHLTSLTLSLPSALESCPLFLLLCLHKLWWY